MTTRLYTFANGGLPSDDMLTAGNFISAIKAALVTGTNKKIAAGWRLVYESLSNPSDKSKRIVVQSQSANSEQCYYEIVDGQSALLTMSDGWDSATNKGTGKLVSVYINKTTWAGETAIIADERFVFLSVTHTSAFFGDYDAFSVNRSSIVLGAKNTDANYKGIPSHNNGNEVGSRVIYDIDQKALCLRNYHFGWRGWSVATSQTDKYIAYGTDNSAAMIRRVDVLWVDSGRATYLGLLPHLIYCDKYLTQGDITQTGKRIVLVNLSMIGPLMFEVDEL